MEFATLATSVKTLDKIVAFVEGGGLTEALAAMGDTELEAAELALRNSKHSKSRKSEVWSAINHLQTAHFAYRRAWGSYKLLLHKHFRNTPFVDALRADQYVSCLLATCYVYVGEIESAKGALTFAKEANKSFKEHYGDESFASVAKNLALVPLNLLGIFVVDAPKLLFSDGKEPPDIPQEEFDAFCKSIELYKKPTRKRPPRRVNPSRSRK